MGELVGRSPHSIGLSVDGSVLHDGAVWKSKAGGGAAVLAARIAFEQARKFDFREQLHRWKEKRHPRCAEWITARAASEMADAADPRVAEWLKTQTPKSRQQPKDPRKMGFGFELWRFASMYPEDLAASVAASRWVPQPIFRSLGDAMPFFGRNVGVFGPTRHSLAKPSKPSDVALVDDPNGEWHLLFRQDTGAGEGAWPKDTWSLNADNPQARNFAILDQLHKYRSADGKFELLMLWPKKSGDNYNHWKQAKNPYKDRSDPLSDMSSYEPLHIGVDIHNSWRDGLWYNGKDALLDAATPWLHETDGERRCQFAIGAHRLINGKVIVENLTKWSPPDTDLTTEEVVELWVRRGCPPKREAMQHQVRSEYLHTVVTMSYSAYPMPGWNVLPKRCPMVCTGGP